MKEFEIDGKKVILDTEFDEDDTGVAYPKSMKKEKEEVDLEKTHQIDIVYDPASLENTAGRQS